MLTVDEERAVRDKIAALVVEHRELDDVIGGMTESVYVDQLQLKRLKKRKLQLRDALERLRSLLIPDMDA